MIQIVLLSGFLGAGKTTLMQRLLDAYSDRKIGVIINEFGEINIDAKLVSRDGIEMAELSNGSIFCACIKDKFVDGLIAMSRTDIEYLFIEASGLADPSNMGEIVEGIRRKTGGNLIIKGSVCVTDGVNFLDLVDMLPALSRQIKHANAVIINKIDLIDGNRLKEVTDKVEEINQYARIYAASHCNVNIREIVENFAPIVACSEDTTNTYESRPFTAVVRADVPVSKTELVEFINAIAPDSYRIKGFVNTDEGVVEVSGVVNNLVITPWKHQELTELVVISSVGIRMLSEITSCSKDIMGGKLYI